MKSKSLYSIKARVTIVTVLAFVLTVLCVILVSINPLYGTTKADSTVTPKIKLSESSVSVDWNEIISEIGSFEIYKISLGQRKTLIKCPEYKNINSIASVDGILLKSNGKKNGVTYDYTLKKINANTVRISLSYCYETGTPVAQELCLGKISSDLFTGAVVNDGKKTITLPIIPRSFNDRILINSWPSVTIQSSVADIKIVPVNAGDISLADFRNVPWDNLHSFYVFSRSYALLPGKWTTLSYDITISPPSLTSSDQFGVAHIKTELPFNSGKSTFFEYSKKNVNAIPIRGVLTELLPPGVKDINIFKGYIRAIAKTGGNTLVLYHSPEHLLALSKHQGTENWWSAEELKDIAAYARSLHIQVIPGMWSSFSSKNFPDLTLNGKTDFYNPFAPRTYHELFMLYQTLIDLYDPKMLLIGHDEISPIQKPTGWSDSQVLVYDISKIHNWLHAKGVRTVMFGDMFLDRNRWQLELTANSNNPVYGSDNTHEALDLLPKDIVIIDWQYKKAKDYSTIEFFKNKGFTVWGCSWHDPEAAIALDKSLFQYKGDGILCSDWGFWRTLNPAATSLYGIKASFDSSSSVNNDGEDAISALAEELRRTSDQISTGKFRPISLDSSCNATTCSDKSINTGALKGLGSSFDLRSLPQGENSFAGITFNVKSCSLHSGNNCLVSHYSNPSNIQINGKRVKSLAFLYTMWHEKPQIVPRKIGSYKIEYTDNTAVEIPVIEGYNITDVRSGRGVHKNPWTWGFTNTCDILIGSRLGWRGKTLSGIPVNLQVMTWKNPEPNKLIKKISLLPNDGATFILIALSALK